MIRQIGMVAALVVASAGLVAAQESERLFAYKHWEVEIVGWDDVNRPEFAGDHQLK